MDSEPSTSMEANKNITAKVDGWTKSLKYVPGFSYEKLEKHLVVDDQKTPDGKPAEAFEHKKKGYKLFKAGYPRQFRVKPNVKKGGEAVYFLVRCNVNVEMKKKQYTVYVCSNIGTDRPGFLRRRKGTAGRHKGTAGRRKGTAGRRKPQQGAALISIRERRALIGRKAYVHPVTYAIPLNYK